jgi:hypothetical protein
MASETTTGSNIDIAEDITVDYVVKVPGTRGISRAVPQSLSCTAPTAP